MKKAIQITIIALIITMLLASCSSLLSGSPGEISRIDKANTIAEPGYWQDMPMEPPMEASAANMDYEFSLVNSQIGGSGSVPVTAPEIDGNLSEKIIYSANADIETTNFDESIEGVYKLLASNGGFIESSTIGGRNYEQSYFGWQTYRNAQFTLRVPKDRLNTITASLDTLGSVTSMSSYAENITAQFFDTQSRLNSYNTQEERLLDMLSKSESVTDMIAIEERLADVRYQIESLASTLKNWQNQVDYSSLYLFISEVEKYTEITPVQQRTYWQQIGDGVQTSAINVGDFFKNLFKWLVIILPVLIIIAAIAVITIIIVKIQVRRRAKRIKQTPQYQQYPQTPQNPQNPQTQQAPQDSQTPQDSQGPR
jgi:flagellar basal body-associated protein FliL